MAVLVFSISIRINNCTIYEAGIIRLTSYYYNMLDMVS